MVANLNGMRHFQACARSVLNQSYPDFEVIPVDNNSSDGSLAYARERFHDLVAAQMRRTWDTLPTSMTKRYD
jgi:glycosyltransferase involved in cell wall biosynthesis